MILIQILRILKFVIYFNTNEENGLKFLFFKKVLIIKCIYKIVLLKWTVLSARTASRPPLCHFDKGYVKYYKITKWGRVCGKLRGLPSVQRRILPDRRSARIPALVSLLMTDGVIWFKGSGCLIFPGYWKNLWFYVQKESYFFSGSNTSIMVAHFGFPPG